MAKNEITESLITYGWDDSVRNVWFSINQTYPYNLAENKSYQAKIRLYGYRDNPDSDNLDI